ncbi:MAG: hypothetical protein C0467_26505 [Planctomycetaceae bacterium]|nr:hypothetical protein [Planctomycetaceae bacterium]
MRLTERPAGLVQDSAGLKSERTSPMGSQMPNIFRSNSRLAAFLVSAVLISGCKRTDTVTPDAAIPPVADLSNVPLTDADYSEFGRSLEKAVAAKDRTAVNQLLRMKEVMQRAHRELNLQLSPVDQERLRIIEERDYLGENIITGVQNGGSYSFLRVRIVDGQKRVLMRVITAEDALTYHDIFLTRYPDGQVGTHDLYDFSKGELMTRLNRHATLTSLVNLYPDLRAQMSPAEQLYSKHMDVSAGIARDIQAGRQKEALATFRALPAEVQKLKVFQLDALKAAQGTTDEDYITELERFLRDHPNGSTADLMSIYYFLIKKKCDNALEAIDRLDKKVGGDPYLSVLMSEALADAGKYDAARTKAEQAIKEEPKLVQAYWERAMVAVKEKNHPDSLTWLKKYVAVSGAPLEPASLETDPLYAEFVKTPQFKQLKQWLAEQGK